MNRVRFEDCLGNHKQTVMASSVPRAVDQLPGGKLPKGWIPIPYDSDPVVDDTEVAELQARVLKLEKALTTSYDLVAEAMGSKQYDWFARATASTNHCFHVLRNRTHDH